MIPKVDVLLEPRDVWVGMFFDWPKVYICLVPMVAIRLTWRRRLSPG
jgi:hypothetical protein